MIITTRTTTRTIRLTTSLAFVAATVAMTCTPAQAADADPGVNVVNTETVQIYTDAAGKVATRRVYEQLALSGKGHVKLSNPVSDQGLRNLDGFTSDYDVKGDQQVLDTEVDGETNLRSVSDYDGDLPLSMAITYELDGKRIKPEDVVGKSGKLEVSYTIKNISAKATEVSFDDGKGGTITKTVDVPIPMVGSLTTVAPPSFSDVASDQANMAGDGKGGTKLSFTVTLIPPIGSDSATFGYTADIVDGVVPRADLTALPVNPLESPSFKTAATSYQGGAETGVELTDGAVEIDTNLLKLRDGAGDLLAGLVQLRDGADELSAGLTNDAAPGARELADGAGQLADGLGTLDDGTGTLKAGTDKLRAGTRQLDDGAGKLNAGSGKLADGAKTLKGGTGSALEGSESLTSGLKQISSGLDQLAGTEGLKAVSGGIEQLKVGVDQLSAGLGDASKPETLIGGLTTLATKLGGAQTGAATIEGGLKQLRGGSTSGLVSAQDGVTAVRSGLADASSTGGSLDQLSAGIGQLRPYCQGDPTCTGTIDVLQGRVGASKTSLATAAAGLGQIAAGLGGAVTALDAQLIPGAGQLATGLGDAQVGANKLNDGAKAASAGTAKVRGGLDSLATGVTKAVLGVVQLATGAGSAYTGSSSLTTGLGKIDAGAGDLADGAQQLNAGTGDLKDGTDTLASGAGDLDDGAGKLRAGAEDAADGSDQVAEGADTLADGLDTAADGSNQLADGLQTAAGGAPALVDGAQRLSDEGTKKLVTAGVSTAQNYGEMYATLAAGAERAQTEDMAFGAPEGAEGLTAYSYVIQGEDGDGNRNLTRGLAGLALLGAGAGVVGLRRKLI